MSFEETDAKTLVENIIDDMKEHKDYSQKLHAIANVMKSCIAHTEQYADRGTDGQGERKIITKRVEAKDVTGEDMTDARKLELYNGCLAKYNDLKNNKP